VTQNTTPNIPYAVVCVNWKPTHQTQQPTKPIILDGSTLEGGGQLIRLAVGLSAFTSIPIKITNIRGNRSAGGGLKAQHLACVNWLAHACNATVSGAEKGSKTLDFRPSSTGQTSPAYHFVNDEKDGSKHWKCELDIKTAGSAGLALQAILPFILFNPPKYDDDTLSKFPTRLTISGGTNVSGSPSYEYIAQVLLPTLYNIGLPPIEARLSNRGWSHGGGSSIGSFTLEIPARQTLALPAFQLQPSNHSMKPVSTSRLDVTFLAPATAHPHPRFLLPLYFEHTFGRGFSEDNDNISLTCEDSKHDKRYYLLIVATIPTSSGTLLSPATYKLGKDWLYDRKARSPEQAVTELVDKVTKDLYAEWASGAYVDQHMRDQLVVFQGLAESGSQIHGGCTETGEIREASLHAKTAEWVLEKMHRR
jgi:RNA 3'-terminal phosphate cyclase (ATP)